jgi:hypothetical protein
MVLTLPCWQNVSERWWYKGSLVSALAMRILVKNPSRSNIRYHSLTSAPLPWVPRLGLNHDHNFNISTLSDLEDPGGTKTLESASR